MSKWTRAHVGRIVQIRLVVLVLAAAAVLLLICVPYSKRPGKGNGLWASALAGLITRDAGHGRTRGCSPHVEASKIPYRLSAFNR